MSPRLQVTNNEVLKLFQGIKLPTLKENCQLLVSDSLKLVATSEQLAEFMLQRKLLKNITNTENINQGQFLPEVSYE